MFRTVFSKTLREYRVPLLGWGIGLGLLVLAEFASVAALGPTTLAGTAQAARMIRLFGEPIAFTTPAGYVTFRDFGIFLPLLLGIWTILAGARLVGGEEERGSLEVVLATPRSRLRVLLEKIAALITALALITLLIACGGLAGEALAQAQVDVLGTALAVLNVGLLALLFSMCALFLSQVLGSRAAAAGWTGTLLAVSYLLDGTGQIVEQASWIGRLSPFFYYHASKPLLLSYTSTHGLNVGAFALLLLVSVAFAAASVPLFVRRELGAMALPLQGRSTPGGHSHNALHALERARGDVFGRAIGLRALRAHMSSACWWIVGLVIYAGWVTILARSMEGLLRTIYANAPTLARLFGGQDIGTNAGFLAGAVFAFVPVVTVIFALAQALTFATDLDRGRMELILSTPMPRYRIALERFAAVCAVAVAAPLAIWLSVLAGAFLTDLSVDAGHVLAASFGVLPLELIVAALVYVLAGRLRAGAILGIVGTFVALAFFAELLHAVLNLSDWVMSLSIFHQYGSPITDGWQWRPFVTMLGIAAVLLTLGLVQFTRSDVERGA
jgi:ABC-2 type transport system permease protein